MFRELGRFILEGELPVIAMLLMAGFAMAVIVERVRALYFQYPVNSQQLWSQLRKLVIEDKIEEAIAVCASQGTALLPKVLKGVLERADRDDENIKTAFEISASEVVPLITRRLSHLAMVANVATLLGLLGTIHGLIQSFQAVSFADPSQKQTLLAQGISTSMNTTALGLFVAIPVMIVFSILHSRQNKLLEEVEEIGAKTVDLLISRNYEAFDEKSAFPTGPVPASPTGSVTSIGKRKSA